MVDVSNNVDSDGNFTHTGDDDCPACNVAQDLVRHVIDLLSNSNLQTMDRVKVAIDVLAGAIFLASGRDGGQTMTLAPPVLHAVLDRIAGLINASGQADDAIAVGTKALNKIRKAASSGASDSNIKGPMILSPGSRIPS